MWEGIEHGAWGYAVGGWRSGLRQAQALRLEAKDKQAEVREKIAECGLRIVD